MSHSIWPNENRACNVREMKNRCLTSSPEERRGPALNHFSASVIKHFSSTALFSRTPNVEVEEPEAWLCTEEPLLLPRRRRWRMRLLHLFLK